MRTRDLAPAPILALLPLVAAAGLGASCGGGSEREPDTGTYVVRVTEDALRGHVEQLARPRNSLQEPDAARAASEYVAARLGEAGLVVRLQDVSFGGQTFPNVIGELKGTECPERVFIVGAHYDSVAGSPGADDNASGVAGVLTAAPALADAELPASVWFVGFAFEEEGLVGSAAMAQALSEENAQVVGMIALEMIGFTVRGPDVLAGQGDAIVLVSDLPSEPLANQLEQAALLYVPDLSIRKIAVDPAQVSDVRRSDHAPFWNVGYRALMFTDGANLRNPNYHKPTDSAESLDFAFATRVTKAAVAGVHDVLGADADGDGQADVCGEQLAPPSGETPSPEPAPTPAGGA